MRVLVTGGRSMIGAGVAAALAGRGDEVVLFQRNASGLPYDEVLGDITDCAAVAGAVRGADAVVHLAARVGVTGTWEEFLRTNVAGTEVLLDAAAAAGVTRLVHVSSPSVAHAGEPLVGAGNDPADPDRARGHYARSKALAERAALARDRDALAVVAVRPHLVWGPGDTQLVGRIVERARTGRLPLVGGGTALVDTTYVDNAVDALVAALDRAPDADVHGRAFVVSNGQPRTVAELWARIAHAAGAPAPARRVPFGAAHAAGAVVERAWARAGRPGDPPLTAFLVEQAGTAHWFDQRETRRSLRWAPRIGLDEGFARLAAWYAGRP